MSHYTAAEYETAKSSNIATYLQSTGYALEKVGSVYKGKLHDSLIIREDGRWYWNSRGIGGRSPIELLKNILINDFGYGDEKEAAVEAIKRLSGACSVMFSMPKEPLPSKPKLSQAPASFVLPTPNQSVSRVMAYLCNTRGLDPEIVSSLIKHRRLYESKDFHNAVFVSYDKEHNPRYAFMRGTYSSAENQFKKEIPFSDKSYAFALPGRHQSGRVFCFEGAIDAISHATLYKRHGLDWQADNRISLGGTSFLGLHRFLEDNPQVKFITVCLDNDSTGLRRGQKLFDEFTAEGFTVDFEYPIRKDFNEDLLHELAAEKTATAKECDFEFEM